MNFACTERESDWMKRESAALNASLKGDSREDDENAGWYEYSRTMGPQIPAGGTPNVGNG